MEISEGQIEKKRMEEREQKKKKKKKMVFSIIFFALLLTGRYRMAERVPDFDWTSITVALHTPSWTRLDLTGLQWENLSSFSWQPIVDKRLDKLASKKRKKQDCCPHVQEPHIFFCASSFERD